MQARTLLRRANEKSRCELSQRTFSTMRRCQGVSRELEEELSHEASQICARVRGCSRRRCARLRQRFGHAERTAFDLERAVVQRGGRALGLRAISLLAAARLVSCLRLLRPAAPSLVATSLASLVGRKRAGGQNALPLLLCIRRS